MSTEEKDRQGEEVVQSVSNTTNVSVVEDAQAVDLQNSIGAKVDDALAGNEKIDLGIDWDSLDKESLFASFSHYDDAENLYPKVPGNKHDTYIMHTGELTTRTGEKLVLEVSKVISPNFHEFQIGIIRPGVDKNKPKYRYVAGFDFLQLKGDKSEEWDMKHRQTSDPYKQQGIAGKIVNLTEEILRKRSANNSLSQSISAKSGQRDFTEWLAKRNRDFKPDGHDNVAMLQRLREGDRSLKDVTASLPSYAAGETYTFDVDEFRRKFPELSGPEDPVVWNDDNYGKPFFYMESCFKIKMKKDIV